MTSKYQFANGETEIQGGKTFPGWQRQAERPENVGPLLQRTSLIRAGPREETFSLERENEIYSVKNHQELASVM